MSKVKAVVMKEPGKIEIQEFAKPKISEDSLLLKVDECGVCGSDKHMYLGHSKLNFPVIPGHEVIGTIEKLGTEAEKSMSIVGGPLSEGDKVVIVPSSQSCGKCYNCIHRPHRTSLCTGRTVYGFSNCEESPHLYGGFAEYMYIHSRSWVIKVPEKVLSKQTGVLAEPMAVATRAVERAFSPGIPHISEGYGIGKSVVVIGTGPIGLLIIAVLKNTGASQIIATDLSDYRLEMAKQMGATDTINASEAFEERVQNVMDLTNGIGADIVIESAGVPQAFKEALDLVARGGKVIELGHYTDPGSVDINPHTICNKDLDIRGVWAYPQIQFKTAVDALAQFEMPLEKLITHKLPLEKTEKAIQLLGKDAVLKVVIEP